MKKPLLLIGHRGAMGHAPENTLASFRLAHRMGVDAVECDVHLTKDNRLAVIHDSTLDRTTSGRGPVRRVPWARLRRLDAGSWFAPRYKGERVPSLPQLLRWIRPRRNTRGQPLQILVEVKSQSVPPQRLARAVVSALKGARVVDRAFVISFDTRVVKAVKRMSPSLRAGVIFDRPPASLSALLKSTNADGLFPRWSSVGRPWLKAAHQRGLFVGAWTVNDAAAWRRVMAAGVDGVATNYPDKVKQWISR